MAAVKKKCFNCGDSYKGFYKGRKQRGVPDFCSKQPCRNARFVWKFHNNKKFRESRRLLAWNRRRRLGQVDLQALGDRFCKNCNALLKSRNPKARFCMKPACQQAWIKENLPNRPKYNRTYRKKQKKQHKEILKARLKQMKKEAKDLKYPLQLVLPKGRNQRLR